jgi:hypothetical protein
MMELRQCQCGSYPSLHADTFGPEKLIQLKCVCGLATAIVGFEKPADAPLAIQSLIDGWNLADE